MFGEKQRQEVSSYGARGDFFYFYLPIIQMSSHQKKGEGLMNCAASIISKPRAGVLPVRSGVPEEKLNILRG